MPLGTTSSESLAQKITEILERLEATYGQRQWQSHGDPLDELIETVLSQHTSDANTERAFASLKLRFPTWNAVLAAPLTEVAEAIRTGGLAAQKAPRIQSILAALYEDRQTLNLDHLSGMAIDEARAWLLRLQGVGPKTAACVLLFSLGLPALPVDTHVHRVAKRLGLIGSTIGADAAHPILESGLGEDRDRVYSFHMSMIAHGRSVCTARRPYCERCPLTESCDYYINQRDADHGPSPSPAPSGGR